MHRECACVCKLAELKIEVQEDWGDSVQEYLFLQALNQDKREICMYFNYNISSM